MTVHRIGAIHLWAATLFLLTTGGQTNAQLSFGTPSLVPNVNVVGAFDGSPSISADGKSLYLVSDRPGTNGFPDIWVSTRGTIHEDFGTPMNLGSPINTSGWDLGPEITITPDGTLLYFDSNQGAGDNDILTASACATECTKRVAVSRFGDVDRRVLTTTTDIWIRVLNEMTAAGCEA